jgi:hypothetical protein
MVAGYLAKYTTKSTEVTGHRSTRLDPDNVYDYANFGGDHIQRLIAACWKLGRRLGKLSIDLTPRRIPGLVPAYACKTCGQRTLVEALRGLQPASDYAPQQPAPTQRDKPARHTSGVLPRPAALGTHARLRRTSSPKPAATSLTSNTCAIRASSSAATKSSPRARPGRPRRDAKKRPSSCQRSPSPESAGTPQRTPCSPTLRRAGPRTPAQSSAKRSSTKLTIPHPQKPQGGKWRYARHEGQLILTPKWHSPPRSQCCSVSGFQGQDADAQRELRSVKDGKYRRILPEWVDEYVARRARSKRSCTDEPYTVTGKMGRRSIFPYRNGYAALRVGQQA